MPLAAGQVYYVYNRVARIAEVAAEVAKMVPDANVVFAHGQMSERELEKIMMAFISGEIDVLVATTIIETGFRDQSGDAGSGDPRSRESAW